jgi:DEAD/DEAH box helicase domain-containing protein
LLLGQALLGDVPLEVRPNNQEKELILADHQEEAVPDDAEPAVGYFDIETQRLADEVGGWGNIHLMRLAVAVLFDQRSQRFEVFAEDRVDDLITRLRAFDLVIGFNIRRFDYRVLSAYTTLPFEELPTFDLLEEIYRRLGFRLSLDHLASQTLGRFKEANGIQAVQWFREGNLDAVIRYCRADVSITRELFEFGVKNGYLVYQTRQGQAVRLPVDWNLERILHEASR